MSSIPHNPDKSLVSCCVHYSDDIVTLSPNPQSDVALVTGASRGLGRACTELLASLGYSVTALGRTVGALEELSDSLQPAAGSVSLAVADITDTHAIQKVCRTLHDRFGFIDLWIHTAIQSPPLTPAYQIDPASLDRALEVNVKGTFNLIANVSHLLRKDGKAVFFHDERSELKFHGAYGATKQAQIALARCWASENVRLGPEVIIYTPQIMATRTTRAFTPGKKRADLADPLEEARKLIASLRLDVDDKTNQQSRLF